MNAMLYSSLSNNQKSHATSTAMTGK